MNQASISILIPAFNEERTVANVVRVALASNLGDVMVVSDGSTDATATQAKEAGAKVLELQKNCGKGGAVAAGIKELKTDLVMLLDADLIGLKPDHLKALLAPVLKGEAQTTAGLLRGGRGTTDLGSQLTPQLSGQRVIPLGTLQNIRSLADRQYAIELAIEDQIKNENLKCSRVALDGVSQIMKEEKMGVLRGAARRAKMYWQILSYALVGRRKI